MICDAPFGPFISFGRQPIANAFLAPADLSREAFYELTVGMCRSCHMLQLGELVDRSRLFHEEYAFFSGTSKGMSVHFERFARDVMTRHMTSSDPFVVEIGSNDGIMLRHFAAAGMRHLGIEPSANVAKAAEAQGVRTLCRFFDEELAREIVGEHGQADAILGANVICHISEIHSVMRGFKLLLKPNGVIVFEDPYAGDIVEKVAYDQFYDEHVFYFALGSLERLVRMHDLQIVDAEPQPVHGGSMRFTVRHRGAGQVSPRVAELAARETVRRLDSETTFVDLRSRIEHSRDELMGLLNDQRARGRSIAGYGATSKSSTVTNYCGIGSELVSYISDTTPIKQGKLSPGTHIPVLAYSEFQAHPPELALLFAWNHASEILEKEAAFLATGRRFIVYVPRVGYLP